jgi:hypothetical protein
MKTLRIRFLRVGCGVFSVPDGGLRAMCFRNVDTGCSRLSCLLYLTVRQPGAKVLQPELSET